MSATPLVVNVNECGLTTLDDFFLLVCGVIVYFMQAGFAFLEAGSISSKNVTNILFKNLMDSLIGAVVWFAVGFAFAFGTGTDQYQEFIGTKFFFLEDLPDCQLSFFFFQFTFAATATTIVSGAMAGRTSITGYIVYSIITTGFIYPAVVYWVWSGDAWLTTGDGTIGYTDFAGSGVVHMTGGTAALIGAWLVGPRKGRFDGLGFDGDSGIPGHSTPLAGLGGFILIFGFFAFNGGSQLAIVSSDEDGQVVALAMVNTILAAAGGGLTVAIFYKFGLKIFCCCCTDTRETFWSFMSTMNGAIAGMVAICAGVGSVRPWAALIIGVIGGISYIAWSKLLVKLRIDDAIGAVPVHLGAGIWGVLAQPIFEFQTGILYKADKAAWESLGWNAAGAVVIFVWAAGTSLLMFFPLKMLGKLRVDDDVEEAGLDETEHGEKALPSTPSDGIPKFH